MQVLPSAPEITLIMPVYNTAKYLDDCLCSIQNQYYKNFEVLIVDDGSTDNSAKICQRFSNQDPRFTYFFLPHQGIAQARNFGLKNAKGRYIGFIDSDDMISPYFLSIMKDIIKTENSDMVVCRVNKFIDGTRPTLPNRETVETILISNPYVFFQSALLLNTYNQPLLYSGGIVTNKLFKRAVLDGASFVTTKGAEDEIFLHDIFSRLNKIVYVDTKLLHYRVRSHSFSHSSEFALNHLKSRFSLLVRCQNLRLEEMLRVAIVQKTFDLFLQALTSKGTIFDLREQLFPFVKLSIHWFKCQSIDLEMLNPNVRRGMLKRLVFFFARTDNLKRVYFCFFFFSKILFLPRLYSVYNKISSLRKTVSIKQWKA